MDNESLLLPTLALGKIADGVLLPAFLHPATGNARMELEHEPSLCFTSKRHSVILSRGYGEVNELVNLDSRFFEKLSTILKTIGLGVPNLFDPSIDYHLRARETGLVSTEQGSALESHTPSSSEGNSVLLRMDCSQAGLLTWALGTMTLNPDIPFIHAPAKS
jgi:hypothetical protein